MIEIVQLRERGGGDEDKEEEEEEEEGCTEVKSRDPHLAGAEMLGPSCKNYPPGHAVLL